MIARVDSTSSMVPKNHYVIVFSHTPKHYNTGIDTNRDIIRYHGLITDVLISGIENYSIKFLYYIIRRLNPKCEMAKYIFAEKISELRPSKSQIILPAYYCSIHKCKWTKTTHQLTSEIYYQVAFIIMSLRHYVQKM